MATTAEILNREELLKPRIYLYKEGVFWKAYQYKYLWYRMSATACQFQIEEEICESGFV